MRKIHSRGFTLIELLVVIAIIGLLASVVIASLGLAQKKARDARRAADMDSFAKAMAIYSANAGGYPIATATTTLTGTDAVSQALFSGGAFSGAVPKDPLSPKYDYAYVSNDVGNEYYLEFCLETDSIPGHTAGCGNIIKH